MYYHLCDIIAMKFHHLQLDSHLHSQHETYKFVIMFREGCLAVVPEGALR